MRFFDSSAVVKAYQTEVHSAQVRGWLAAPDVATSRLTDVEVASALSRLAREGAMSADRVHDALFSFRADVRKWQVVELTPDVVSIATRLLGQHPLRASDAIQLASALVLQHELGLPLDAFVVYDRRLADAARREHLTVIDS